VPTRQLGIPETAHGPTLEHRQLPHGSSTHHTPFPVPSSQEQQRRGIALEFVTAAANCRAANYRLPTTDRVGCRRAVGWALPAVPPAAALAAALACVEVRISRLS
jgi:hypothetical protein